MLSGELLRVKLQFLMIWYILNVSRPNGHKLLFCQCNFCADLPCSSILVGLLSPQLPPCNTKLYMWHYNDNSKLYLVVVEFSLLVSSFQM